MVTPYKNKCAQFTHIFLEQTKISTCIDCSPKDEDQYTPQFINNMKTALKEMTLDDEELNYVECVIPKETNYYIPPMIRQHLGDKELLNLISDLSI